MTQTDDIKLEDIDPEDIGDVLVRLGKSFGIKYSDIAFKEAKTFGDICDTIAAYINLEHQDNCTKQQAFYRIREAINLTQKIEEKRIELDTELEDIFPGPSRRQNVKRFQRHLGIKIDFLRMKEWLVWTIFSGFLFSLIALFFSWKITIGGLAFFYTFSRIATLFSTELEVRTIRELTEKMTRENYLLVRRRSSTVNKNEIFKIIQNTFSADLDLDKTLLTREASLGWN